MKIIAFVGETFQTYNGRCYAKPTSAAFLQDAIGTENVYVCSPSYEVNTTPTDFSTEVAAEQFYSFPSYNSTKEFALKTIVKRGYLKQYQSAADAVIKKHPGEYFWIRTPSIGSIVFGLRVLAAGEKLIHHMCADASNTWRDAKYSLPEKAIGYLLSRFIRRKLAQICKNQNTLNLCTGDALEKFSCQNAPNSTYQFVDLMVKKPSEAMNTINNKGIIRLLFIGRVVEDKGILDLIFSVSKLKEDIELTVIGDGPDLKDAMQLAKDLKLCKKVFFTGQLPHDKLAPYLSSCTLVVVPSNNYYEGFPRVIMEAWAYKKPVLVSKVGGVTAFVKHGVNGLVFEQGDKVGLSASLQLLVQDEKLLIRLQEGAEQMQHLSTQQYWIEHTLNILGYRNEA